MGGAIYSAAAGRTRTPKMDAQLRVAHAALALGRRQRLQAGPSALGLRGGTGCGFGGQGSWAGFGCARKGNEDGAGSGG